MGPPRVVKDRDLGAFQNPAVKKSVDGDIALFFFPELGLEFNGQAISGWDFALGRVVIGKNLFFFLNNGLVQVAHVPRQLNTGQKEHDPDIENSHDNDALVAAREIKRVWRLLNFIRHRFNLSVWTETALIAKFDLIITFCLHFTTNYSRIHFTMKIILNGHPKELHSQTNLKDLIGQFCKDTRPVIAEVNGDIIKAAGWEQRAIGEGDRIELVNFVGGG